VWCNYTIRASDWRRRLWCYNDRSNYGIPFRARFLFGEMPVQFMMRDAAGNTAFCSFTVTIKDVVAPAFFL
jgi:hypothetical protein